jgi:hypothetical protein
VTVECNLMVMIPGKEGFVTLKQKKQKLELLLLLFIFLLNLNLINTAAVRQASLIDLPNIFSTFNEK